MLGFDPFGEFGERFDHLDTSAGIPFREPVSRHSVFIKDLDYLYLFQHVVGSLH